MKHAHSDDALEAKRVSPKSPLRLVWSAARSVLQKDREVTYSVLGDKPAFTERRMDARRRMRLRSGKIVDLSDRFLVECQIANRSRDGICLKLARSVPTPDDFRFFDDQDGKLKSAYVIWRRGVEIGCTIAPHPLPNKERIMSRLKSAYYAV